MMWVVLRCAGKNTMPLVQAMEKRGLDSWTPLWRRKRRYPRSSKYRTVVLPALPTFVFLAEKDMWSALDALTEFATPGFSLMHSYGEIIRIKDAELASLRKISDVKPAEKNPVVWPQVGERRRVTSGAFTGMTGLVKGKTKHHCLVELDGSRFPVVKIPPFLLNDIGA